MKIRIEKISEAGNNVVANVFFDDRIVTPQGLHCSPAEFENFVTAVQGGAVLAAFEEVVIKT